LSEIKTKKASTPGGRTMIKNNTSDYNLLCHPKFMNYKTNTVNTYKEGTIITARVNPGLKLIITKYYKGAYYCSVVGDPARRNMIYFKGDLVPPITLEQ
jgi:hypothetical protein